MGQAKRRKAEIDRLKRTRPNGLSAIAIHEAGHAVARFMTAKRMGYDCQADALMRVVIHPRETAAKFIARDGILRYSGGRTFGPWFSKEIEATLDAANVRHDAVETSLKELRPVIAAARAAGANIDNWVYAKVIQSLAGPAAEAKAMGRPCNEILAENEGDRDQASLACLAAGAAPCYVKSPHTLRPNSRSRTFGMPCLCWQRAFPKDGEMDGRDCWMIFSNVCQADQWRIVKKSCADRQESIHPVITAAEVQFCPDWDQMSVPSSNRNIAPIGYLELRAAIASVRRRMFTSEIPVWLIEAARANLAEAANLTSHKNLRISVRPRMPAYPEPIKLVADAIETGRLTLFIFAENFQRVIPVPVNCTQEILERVGFLRSTRETIGFRFMGFFPRRILAGLDLPEINMAQFDKFSVCLRESAFDSWLAITARQQYWPLDAIPRSGRGRPRLVPIVKSIVKDLIDSGQWRQGMPLKALVVSIQPKIKDAKVDRETVKKAMDELYHETRQLKYRYARRERKVLAKRRTR